MRVSNSSTSALSRYAEILVNERIGDDLPHGKFRQLRNGLSGGVFYDLA